MDGLVVRAGVVVGRQVLVEFRVGDGDVQAIAELLEVLDGQLLHLMGGVAGLEVRAEGPALDRLGEDHGRLTLHLGGGFVGGVHLSVIVATALQRPDLIVGPVLDEFGRTGVATEEVIADECAVLGLVGLEVAVVGVVHQVHERAVAVGCQKFVPLAAPHDLDHIPTGTAE